MPNPETRENDIVISYLGLRKAIGLIGLSIPVLLALSGIFFLKDGIAPSISQFYYTPMRDFLVGALTAIGVFLAAYRGYAPQRDEKISDRALGLITGLSAIGVALFPTAGYCTSFIPGIADSCPETQITTLHFALAVIFLLGLGIFSYFKFPRYDPDRPRNMIKAKRVKYYRFCGGVIFATLGAITLILLYQKVTGNSFPVPDWLFWLESLAVIAFGISWLIKGEALRTMQNLLGRPVPDK